jgi:hypothetical protein
MALDIKELRRRAKEYVESQARTTVTSVRYVATFNLFGQEDVVLSIKTADTKDPNWWVVGGTTPMNLYSKRIMTSADEAFSFHTGLMMRMLADKYEEAPDDIGYDAFISHASEDKDTFVRPLAEALTALGFRIWYDEFALKVGDSLRQSIDQGLVNSNYGIVVLSPAFFAKNWPQYELNGLTAREMDGHKIILPIWHDVSRTDVLGYSPTLADKVALNTNRSSVETIANQLAEVLYDH